MENIHLSVIDWLNSPMKLWGIAVLALAYFAIAVVLKKILPFLHSENVFTIFAMLTGGTFILLFVVYLPIELIVKAFLYDVPKLIVIVFEYWGLLFLFFVLPAILCNKKK